jgi:hypothetical protein
MYKLNTGSQLYTSDRKMVSPDENGGYGATIVKEKMKRKSRARIILRLRCGEEQCQFVRFTGFALSSF